MREIGLMPSDTGAAGGKETGQKVSHYIMPGGVFDQACTEWLKSNAGILYHDRAGEDEASAKTRKKKAASKTKYTCPDREAAVCGKPGLNLVCGDCECKMEAETENSL